MPISKRALRDLAVSIVIMCLCLGVSILLQDVFLVPEQVTTTFAFAVFLISLLTDGYWWGIAASVASLLLVNYAFTFPYFALNFLIPSNFFSTVVMAIISVLTSALTTQVKRQEAIRAETEKEKMRANLLRAISHDLRTPLTTIYGSSTALRENGDSLTPEQKDRMLQGIQMDSQWLVRMVENLLAVTRIDNGNIQLTKVSTALDELIDSVLVKFYRSQLSLFFFLLCLCCACCCCFCRRRSRMERVSDSLWSRFAASRLLSCVISGSYFPPHCIRKNNKAPSCGLL